MQYFSSNTINNGQLIIFNFQLNKPDGTIANDLSYDAWGNRRNPSTWAVLNSSELSTLNTTLITDRGYTLHEHLNQFALINMNGRAYDSRLGQFLSPDPFVQAPENTQSYNRYAYCLNNPMKYTDPSGYEWYRNKTTGEYKYNEGALDDSYESGNWSYVGMTRSVNYSKRDGGGLAQFYTNDGTIVSLDKEGKPQCAVDKDLNSWTMGEKGWEKTTISLKEFVVKPNEKIDDENPSGQEVGGETFKHVVEATGLGADAMNTPISITKAVLKESGKALEGFTRTGTVIGAIAGGGPAIYNIATNHGGNWKDWAALGLSVAGVTSEFFGVGEIWDSVAIPVTVGVTVGTVGFDVYNILDEDKTKHK
ncbi:MAG: RHS repeat-associated core domain-containing protein [Bacteroidota bacterium]